MEDDERLILIDRAAGKGSYGPMNDDIWFLLELLRREQDHSVFLESLLKESVGEGWDKLTLFNAQKLNERTQRLIDIKGLALETVKTACGTYSEKRTSVDRKKLSTLSQRVYEYASAYGEE
jgi:rubrerythrin